MGNVFYFVFGLSGFLRLSTSIYFLPKIHEEKFVKIKIKGPKSKKIINITPKTGIDYEYVPRKR